MNIFRNMLCMARRFKTATALNFLGLVVRFRDLLCTMDTGGLCPQL